MKLPHNPNVRQPYSDVYQELDFYLWRCLESTDPIDRKCLDRSLLRARAVLDPESLTDSDWYNAKQTAFELAIQLKDEQCVSPPKA